MAITGQAMKFYQREYMRRYRSNKRKTQVLDPTKEVKQSSGCRIDLEKVRDRVVLDVIEKQSVNPMMVGYEPLR